MTRKKPCERCDRAVTRPDRNIYCSQECYRLATGRRLSIPRAICETCGKQYKPGGADKGRFCSLECYRRQISEVVSASYANGARKQHAWTKATDDELLEAWDRLRAGELIYISDIMDGLAYSRRDPSNIGGRLRKLVGDGEYNAVKADTISRKYPKEIVEEWLEQYKILGVSLDELVERCGIEIGPHTLGKVFNHHFPAEYEAIKALNKPKLYKRGRTFEYRCRDYMRGLGYYVFRSPQSRGPADLLALKGGEILLVQCKLSNKSYPLPRKESEALLELAQQAGGIPLLAYRKKKFGPIVWINLHTDEEWVWSDG